ncbi:hypothetical protein AVEN_148789-1 [Araneus ventricosus]|uniref:Uncharacterized protein n=1 Tax=Araneus ventricosus TaxID=182803 RepID=A0A4Y2KP84_ARAVE|nr:hypothetical protein AVEN_148789-1 [Araneus ventricosus]
MRTIANWLNGLRLCLQLWKFPKRWRASVAYHFAPLNNKVDAKLYRVTRNNNDWKKFEDWFICHNPFPAGEYLILLSTGVVGDEKINCHLSDRIGHSSLESIGGTISVK